MKRTKKVFALLMSAIFAFSMVPAGAWADSGRMDNDDKGTITINNAKLNETYSIYRIFDLYSFDDSATAPGKHATDKYSYVINENSPWYSWLQTTKGYAVEKTDAWTASTLPSSGQLFWLEKDPIVIGDDNYRVVTATSNFTNAMDVAGADVATTDTSTTDNGFGTFDYDGTDYVSDTRPSIATVQAFAQDALSFARTPSNLTGNYAGQSAIAGDTPVTFNDLPLGYYLMGTTMGTLASLDTTNKSVTVYEKNEVPSLTKLVSTEENGTYQKNVTADIGDKVYFKTTVTAKQGALDYTLHDVMETGFSYGKDTTDSTKILGEIVSVTLTRNNDGTETTYDIPSKVTNQTMFDNTTKTATNWTEKSKDTDPALPTESADGCDFEIAFEDSFIGVKDQRGYVLDIKDDDIITIVYTATVNNTAVIKDNSQETTEGYNAQVMTNDGVTVLDGQPKKDKNTDDRNTNTTIMTYGNKSCTNWDSATVTTYQFDIAKTTKPANGTAHDLLKDAEFALYKATTTIPGGSATTKTVNNTTYYLTSTALSFVYKNDGKYMLKGEPITTNSINSVAVNDTIIKSVEGHEINLCGLASGTYLLEETKAPTGYNQLAHPIVITINDGGAGANGLFESNEGKISINAADNNGKVEDANPRPWNATLNNSNQYDTSTTSQGGVHIINQTGPELPSTGGIGTTVFYVVGGALVAVAAVVLVTKRRMGTEA